MGVRGAGVQAVSPAQRGRSGATRLDGGEHTRTLWGLTMTSQSSILPTDSAEDPKFALWFLVEFCLSVRSSALQFFPSCRKTPPLHVTIATSNAMVMLGTRGRIPNSLHEFLRTTFGRYIERENTGAEPPH